MHSHEGEQSAGAPLPAGYCITCKGKRELSEAKQIERGGGPAVEGKCSACGTKIYLMGMVLRPSG